MTSNPLETSGSPVANDRRAAATLIVVAEEALPPVPLDSTPKGGVQETVIAGLLSLSQLMSATDTQFRPLGMPALANAGWTIERVENPRFAQASRVVHIQHVSGVGLEVARGLDTPGQSLPDGLGGLLVDTEAAGDVLLKSTTSGPGDWLRLHRAGDGGRLTATALAGDLSVPEFQVPVPSAGDWVPVQDAWLAAAVRERIASTDPLAVLDAASMAWRLVDDDLCGQDLTSGVHTVPYLAWAQALAPDQHLAFERIAAQHADFLLQDLSALMGDPDTDEPEWGLAMDRLLERRDSLEGARLVLLSRSPVPLLTSALSEVDALGEQAAGGLPPWETEISERLRRAWIADPEQWWVAPIADRVWAELVDEGEDS